MWRHFRHPENPTGLTVVRLFGCLVAWLLGCLVVVIAKATARNKTKADGQHFCDKRTSFTLQCATKWQMCGGAGISGYRQRMTDLLAGGK